VKISSLTDPARERNRLFADLFHALNQPLTTLRCSLELAEQEPFGEEQYRCLVGASRERVEQVAELLGGLRELLDAEDPGARAEILDLGPFLQDAVAELVPVAEVREVKLALHYRSLAAVKAEPRRFRHALFHLLEGAIEAANPGSRLQMEVLVHGSQAVITLSSDRNSAEHPRQDLGEPVELAGKRFLWWRMALAIAARAFEAAGGTVVQASDGCQLTVQVRLPLAK
jgi:signal transduction histidine kinase